MPKPTSKSATVPDQQRGLKRGWEQTPACRICTWPPKRRLRLIKLHLEGVTQRQLEQEFGVSKTAIGDHLRHCVTAEVARQRAHRHRALDWPEILGELADVSEQHAAAIRDGYRRGDMAAAMAATDKFLAIVQTRIDLADRIRRNEHSEICEGFRRLAAAFVMARLTSAPAAIDKLLEDLPHAVSVLELDEQEVPDDDDE